MTPAEYKNEGKNLKIANSFADSWFGRILIASTTRGICYIAFNESTDLGLLIDKYPNATFINSQDEVQKNALQLFENKNSSEVILYLKGTDFQLNV